MERYYRYSQYLKNKYGVRTYKLSLNLNLTCPNRDGFLGEEGCFYCGEDGASFDKSNKPVQERLLELKKIIADKYQAEKFIAYFQNFTNTYLPLKKLKDNVEEAFKVDDIVEVALSTRPDCINDLYLKELKNLAQKYQKNITIELGLQTVNYHTLKKCNRKHSLAEFIDAVLSCHKYNIETGIHLILNLPGDKMIDIIENAKILSSLKINTVKLHALYIRKNTRFARMYKKDKIRMITLDQYIKRVITFLQYLDPEISIQRLLGKAPQEKTIFVNWGYNYFKIQNMILNEMRKRDIYQGQKFDYLQGKALEKFKT